MKQCVRCSKFLTTEKYKSIHNFLKHYDEGKSVPFEEKPIDIVRIHGLTIYSIDFINNISAMDNNKWIRQF